jgi:Protein kinase domain
MDLRERPAMVYLSEAARVLDAGKRIFNKRLLSPAVSRLLSRVEILMTDGSDRELSHREAFDGVFLALFAATDPLSTWFQQYARYYGIDPTRILADVQLPPARLAAATSFKPEESDLERVYEAKCFRESTAIFVLLVYASDLAAEISKRKAPPIDVRHLFATYLYRIREYNDWQPRESEFEIPGRQIPEPVDFLSRLKSWGVDREDLSAALITYVGRKHGNEESGWVPLHATTFGRQPRLPHGSAGIRDESRFFETLFHEYEIQRNLGQGGAGTVYEVADEGRRRFALKRLNSHQSNSQKLDRVKREVEFCLKDQHRNILNIYDYGFRIVDDKKERLYVMPLYAGTLRILMKAKIAPQKIVPYFSQILDAVEFAHSRKIWHRDLKPENLLYDKERDLLVLADFGIAHFEEDALHVAVKTKKKDVLENFRYAAPEQRESGHVVDWRADIYALGLMLNELFTRVVPQGTQYKSIASVLPEFAALDETISLMIRQDPSERLATISDVRSDIDSRLPGSLDRPAPVESELK